MVREPKVRREVDPPAAHPERDLGAAGARMPGDGMHVGPAVEAEAPLVEVGAPVGLEQRLAVREHDRRTSRKCSNEGRLLGGDALEVAEELEVLGPDRSQHAHIGLRRRAETGELARRPRAELADARGGAGLELGEREGDAELVVVARAAGHGWQMRREQRTEDVLERGLPGRRAASGPGGR